VEKAHFDALFRETVPEPGVRGPGAKGVRQDPDDHPATRGSDQSLGKGLPGHVVLQNVGLDQDLPVCPGDGLEDGGKRLLAAEVHLHGPAHVDGALIDPLDEGQELRVPQASDQALGDSADVLRSELRR
jgi:hypothetical protein